VFALEFLRKVVDKTVVEVLTTQVSVTGGGLHLENTLLDGQEGHIEGSSSEIEDKDVTLTNDFLVKTVSDSSSSGLIDDTKNVHSGDGTSVFRSLSLRVVEVRRDSNNSVGDGVAQVGLSGLLHLEENHRRDFFRRKLLLFPLVLHSDVGFTTLVENSEGEVLDVRLDLSIVKFTTDETLGVENTTETR
jgi:hypothetical protein